MKISGEKDMMFKNSLKLFCSNFDKVWKYFFYMLIVSALTISLMMPFFAEIKTIVIANWTDEMLKQIPSTGLLYGKEVAGLFGAIWTFTSGCFVMMFKEYLWIGVYLVFLLFILFPFLMNVGKYVINEMLYNYMSSQAKVGFCSVMVKTLKNSTSYAILKTLMSVIFKAILILAIFGIVSINEPLFDYFLPVVVIVGLSLLISIEQTFISGWAPASVIYGFNVVKSYKIGIRAVFRRYGRVFSTSLVINIIFIFLIFGFGIVASAVFIPVYFGMINMFEMVMFFGSQGMRYYVDADTVLTPKKLEQTDNIQKTKYLL